MAPESTISESPYLTTAEVASLLRWSNKTSVMRHAKAGHFPGAVKRGRVWLIPRSAIESFLAQPTAPQSVPVQPQPVSEPVSYRSLELDTQLIVEPEMA